MPTVDVVVANKDATNANNPVADPCHFVVCHATDAVKFSIEG